MELKDLKRLLDLRAAEELSEEEETELEALEAKASEATEEEEEEEERGATDAEIRSLVNKAIEKQTKATKRVAPEVTKPEAKVVRDEADSEQSFVRNTLQLFNGLITKRDGVVQEAQTQLAKAGHYGSEVQSTVRAAGDYYSSVVDADGAYLLPTKVRDQVERKIGSYGAFAQVSDMWPETEGTIRVPASTGSLKAYAVAEGGEIESKKRAFQAVELFPKKWALIIPWTFEIELRQGQKVLDDVNAALAMGFAEAQDEAATVGDGSSSFNSVTGLFDDSRTDVGSITVGTGDAQFDDITPDQLVLARNEIAPEFRRDLAYIFHPDMEAIFLTRKDDDNNYIFDYTTVNGVNSLKGLPVYYTQAMPASSVSDQEGTAFGLIGNFNLWKIATGGGIYADMLREGTVKDADTGTDFNLATQDGKALRVKQLFDMDTNFEEGFAKFVTSEQA